MKLLIIGHARHGKDHAAQYLSDQFGMTFKSSSEAAAEIFLYQALKEKYGYTCPKECFEDRINHRAEWFNLITEYNSQDKARLAREILKTSDCYVGMRSSEEIQQCLNEGLFDLIIWIDASGRLALESSDSFQIDKSISDIIVENNQQVKEFERKLYALGLAIF